MDQGDKDLVQPGYITGFQWHNRRLGCIERMATSDCAAFSCRPVHPSRSGPRRPPSIFAPGTWSRKRKLPPEGESSELKSCRPRLVLWMDAFVLDFD